MEKIKTFAIKKEMKSIDLYDTFKFNPKKKYKWLQKLCLNTLYKLGCYTSIIDTNITTIQITPKKFIEELLRQQHQIMKLCNYRPEKVYMGQHDFYTISGEIYNDTYPMTININYDKGVKTKDDYVIYGLRVTIIPWMEGILVVPPER